MLEVKDLKITAHYAKKEIVHGISFSVGKGETLGIVGESGSGKSMTSKCIMGLLNSRAFVLEGQIRWKDQEINISKNHLPDHYRGKQITMIPQNPMTAFAPMVKLGKQLKMGFSDTENFDGKLSEILKSMNLNDCEKIFKSYPSELSGGMLQRIMIAITLLQAPELIIADEVTTAVDAASEYQILMELEKLKKKGTSMIVVTHDFGVAAKLCDKISVMKSGKIIEQGETKKVFASPQHEYTKQLLEASMLFRR
ncbi:MAG: ABC transporter ATP-binding protein [Ruminococcus sp.]|nr:ABC transporter ATP-binding protein [Ruminococcus sp.]